MLIVLQIAFTKDIAAQHQARGVRCNIIVPQSVTVPQA